MVLKVAAGPARPLGTQEIARDDEVLDLGGSFVDPESPHCAIEPVHDALREHAAATDPVGLARARNQIMVRSLCAQEVPSQRMEIAALDLFAFDRVRSRDELMAGIAAVGPAEVRDAFARMVGAGAAVALKGAPD